MINLNEINFEQNVSEGLVLVDFWAPWCGPCRAQAAILDKLDADKVKVCKVNTDENPALSQRFKISSIPTLVVFKDGKESGTGVGLHSLEQLKALLGI